MRNYVKASFLAFMVAATSQFVQAKSTVVLEPVDWSAQFAGLDGVVIMCIRTIKRKYARRACQKLMDYAAETLKRSGVPHVVAGAFYSRDPAPKRNELFNNPLNLTIHVRATDPNPLGMDIRMNASVSYIAAVETEGNTAARRGELLMWQRGTTGAGPARKLEPAIVQTSKKRMDELLGHINESWQR